MKNYFNCTFLFAFSIIGFSQINYERGYFINNEGEQVNCLIKNIDWKNNPTEFEYRLTENSEAKTTTIRSVSEFVVTGRSKYVRANVEMDRSSENLNNLSTNKSPKFKEEELFLKVLVEGDKVLYRYYDHQLQRYFFNLDSSKIVQLVYKVYEVTTDKGSKYFDKNEMFKQQLFNDVNCELKSINAFMNVSYKQKSLINFFINHNKCKGGAIEDYNQETDRDWFNLRIRPGINFSSLKVENHFGTNKDVDFGAKTNFRLGVEAEFVLPFNNNKWAMFIEPTYQYFKGEVKGIYYSPVRTEDFIVDYKSIEVPVGIRHKFFIGDNLNIFLSAAYVFDFELNSKITRTIASDLEVNTRNNLAFGIGGEFLDRFSLEFRFGASRQLVEYVYWDSKYNTSSIIFGYKLF